MLGHGNLEGGEGGGITIKETECIIVGAYPISFYPTVLYQVSLRIKFSLADSIDEMDDEELGSKSRIFFINTPRRIPTQDTTTPSVNFRGLMDPVSALIVIPPLKWLVLVV